MSGSAPTLQIFVGFGGSANFGDSFILNDAVKGKLNGTTYTLAGFIMVDVSQWLSGVVNSNRGRSREVDQYQAGTLTFTLRNEDRRFDPSNTSSPYYPGIIPRAPVTAFAAGEQVFGGYVDDYVVDYEQPKICTVDISCLDGFCVPANTYLNGYSPGVELPGARITDVLNTVGYPDGTARSIAVGHTELSAGTFNNVFALDHLQMTARSENGFLFVDRTGVMTFRDRYFVSTESSRMWFNDSGFSGPGFAEYQAITQKSESLLLYNIVTGTASGGVQQSASDVLSIAQYLPRQLLLGQLGNNTDSDVLNLCEYLVGRYAQPDVRMDTVEVELQSVSSAVQAQLMALDLVNLVNVSRTPAGSGSPTVITILEIIDGIALAFDVSNATYTMTLTLGSADTRNFFKLNDPVFGVLDTSKLGY